MEPGDEGAQFGQVVGFDRAHPVFELVTVQVQHHVSESANVFLDAGRHRAGGGERLELLSFTGLEIVRKVQDPAGDLPDAGRCRCRWRLERNGAAAHVGVEHLPRLRERGPDLLGRIPVIRPH
ncbi:hypothetical protein GCM10023195_00100 [Actinoallomurus liliacearum]|uniref:Uncharacterized protein n=1 Tax=Actinoallomurus liliacearum TaxID=1080073 RepID=A0ABP8TBS4_9ACTN